MTYKEIEHGLVEKLRQIQDMFIMLEADEEIISVIRKNLELMNTKKYTVAVVGEFKRGKSSLINTLLGGNILPADVLPATATVNRITFGGVNSQLRALVKFKNASSSAIDITELFDYVTKVTDSGARQAAMVEEVIVYAPAKICENHIDIIDTPGLNDEANMTEITYNALTEANAVIFTISTRVPVTETEAKSICDIIKNDEIHNLIFVITFIDTFDEDADTPEEYNELVDNFLARVETRIKDMVMKILNQGTPDEAIIQKANDILNNMLLFGLSSKFALESFSTNSREKRMKSRFDTFNDTLLRVLTAKQVENAVNTAVIDIKRLLSSEFDSLYMKKKTSYEHEFKKMRDSHKNVIACAEKMGKNLSLLVSDHHTKIEDSIRGLRQYKNEMVSLFIKELSSIRNDTHTNISNALRNGEKEVQRKMDENILPEIIYHTKDTLEQISAKLHTKVSMELSRLQWMGHDENKEILSQMKKEFEEDFLPRLLSEVRTFSWASSALPKADDLTKVNVIETVITAIDSSIARQINNFDNMVNSARSKLFMSVNEASQRIMDSTNKLADEKANEYDMKLKALKNNYELLSGDTGTILNECDLFLTNLKNMGS